ncbi:acyltransferase family protein [Chitinophaga oryziterrae]|uniref:Acyltransferase family protein n=1 Tax=Chitinophaga oryziterrae TaxID=1031224 RepID=A0A6N8JCB6_9BACT|nr:acyltransferase [Chitinophaga oryziterrae]MVT42088.1 acyltransferase family protein [Chitinophaga oryziterrae]
MKDQLPFLNLRRITSNGMYVPEIDGLRFIAITSVVIFHMNGFWIAKMEEINSVSVSNTLLSIWNSLAGTGRIGVELFFVISGYILGLPFANKYLGSGKDVRLKNYYKRRITRLEPPYIIIMVILFFVYVYVVHKYTFSQLLPSLLASLTYTHNFFYGRGILPLINSVAWSLEIEVQFYLLAPLLAKVFLLSKEKRRMVLILASFAVIIFQGLHTFPLRSIIDYLQFFLIGLLFADFKVTNDVGKKLKVVWVMLIGSVSFSMIFFTYAYNDNPANILFSSLLFIWIAIFNYMCMFQNYMKGFLSSNIISITGGMCYSIYLIHYALISLVGNQYLHHLFFKSYYLNLVIYYALLITFIMIVSSMFFVLVERPCMNKDWPVIFLNNIKERCKTVTGVLRVGK